MGGPEGTEGLPKEQKRLLNIIEGCGKQLRKHQAFSLKLDPNRHDEFLLSRKLSTLETLRANKDGFVEELRGYFAEADDQAQLSQLMDDDYDFNDLYDQVVAMINRFMAEHKKISPKPEPETPNSSSTEMRLRLPEIPLPLFNGDYDQWLTYKDEIGKVVLNNKALDDALKLQYLRRSLRGPAADIQSSADTCESLWNAVVKRYEIPRVIVNNHIQMINNIKAVKADSPDELRHLLDVTIKSLRVLELMKLPLDPLSEQFVVNLVCNRLDEETRIALDGTFTSRSLPKWVDILEFLENRCLSLESVSLMKFAQSKSTKPQLSKYNTKPSYTGALPTITQKGDQQPIQCPMCNRAHYLNQCHNFLALNTEARWAQVEKLKFCTNCLYPHHTAAQCKSGTCRVCQTKHHTLLHTTKENPEQIPEVSTALTSRFSNPITRKKIMMSTVVVIIYDFAGAPHICRAVLDSAAESNYITENLIQTLRMRKFNINMIAGGLACQSTAVRKWTTVTIKSRVSDYTLAVDCLIISTITGNLPSKKIDLPPFSIPDNVHLADPQFGTPQGIDLLIGAEFFYAVHLNNTLKVSASLPPLQETVFGWVVGGAIPFQNESQNKSTFCALSVHPTNLDLQNELKRFWEIESCELPKPFTIEEKQVEEHFRKTVKRQQDGRYVVTLPTTENVSKLGDSHQMALRRFHGLERRFERDPEIKEPYSAFMNEYELLDHMSPTLATTNSSEINYYLPHHAVVKPDSSTTKLRVVFDGSSLD